MPRPPMGYTQEEYPLHHEFDYLFTLDITDETMNSTICLIITSSESAGAPEAIEVNPRHASFAEETGFMTHQGSIIPRLTVKFTAVANELALETDKIKHVNFNWLPIYSSFESDLEAMDSKTNTEVEDVLQLEHASASKRTIPTYSGVDMVDGHATALGSCPLATVNAGEVFGDMGLTTNAELESVAFDADEYFDCLKFMTNRSMLRKVAGNWHNISLPGNHPSDKNNKFGYVYDYFSNNKTMSSVKRSNEFTFCGILFHIPLENTVHQICPNDTNTAGSGVKIKMHVSYDEWNHLFDQTPF